MPREVDRAVLQSQQLILAFFLVGFAVAQRVQYAVDTHEVHVLPLFFLPLGVGFFHLSHLVVDVVRVFNGWFVHTIDLCDASKEGKVCICELMLVTIYLCVVYDVCVIVDLNSVFSVPKTNMSPTLTNTVFSLATTLANARHPCLHVPDNLTAHRANLNMVSLASVHTPMSEFLANSDSDDYLPSIIDYRLADKVVSPVKDQGQCGSCWAFSSAESLEGQLGLNGHRTNVSTQNFVDCVAVDYGCGGGWMDDALAYAEKTGVETDADYPYTAVAQNCQANASQATIRPTAYVDIPASDDALRRALLVMGPVSIALDATDNFQMYNSSDYIFNDDTCDPTTPDHALLLVGYNDVEKYWIVKNSWNTDWGLNGYIYINNTLPNMCGISSYAVTPYIEPHTTVEERHRVLSHMQSIPEDCGFVI